MESLVSRRIYNNRESVKFPNQICAPASIKAIFFLLLPPANVVCEGYVFTGICLSTLGGGWYPSMHCRWYPSVPCSRSPGGSYPSMPCRSLGPHPGGKLRGLAWGVSRPTPGREVEGSGLGGSGGPHPRGLQAHTWGVSQHALRQTPP